MVQLTQEEIVDLTTRVPTPVPFPRDSETAFQLPTLLPNTMYAYNAYLNVKNHYPEPVALSPQSTIPVIDLCSTDEEDEGEAMSSISLLRDENGELVLADDKYWEQNGNKVEEVEPVFCDKISGPNTAVYPVIETPYKTYAQIGSSCFDEDTFTVQYTSEPSLRLSKSVPQDWQTNICMKSPPSASPASAFTHEEKHATYSSALHCNSAEIRNLANSEKRRRVQTKNFSMISSSSEEAFNNDEVEEAHTPFHQHNTAEYLKLYSAYVPLIRTRIDSETQLSLPSSASSTSLTTDFTGAEKSNSKHSFPCTKEKMEVAVKGTTSDTPSFISESDLESVTDGKKSRHPVSSLNHRKEQTLTQVYSTPSKESSHNNVKDACLSLCEEKGKQQTNLLRMIADTSSPVPTHGKSTSLDVDTMDTTVSHHSVPTLPCRRVRYRRKVCSTTPFSTSLAQTLQTDGNVASYVSLQSNLAESVKMHRSKKSIPLRKEQSPSKVVITPLPVTVHTFSQDGEGTAGAPLHCDTADNSKLQHSNRSLPHRRDRTQFAKKRVLEEPQHVEDPDPAVPAPKKPNPRVYKETVPRLESKTQVSAISGTLSLLYNYCPLVYFLLRMFLFPGLVVVHPCMSSSPFIFHKTKCSEI
jgi:hypothetical protein